MRTFRREVAVPGSDRHGKGLSPRVGLEHHTMGPAVRRPDDGWERRGGERAPAPLCSRGRGDPQAQPRGHQGRGAGLMARTIKMTPEIFRSLPPAEKAKVMRWGAENLPM